jgi:hypothetical protein
MTRRRRASDLPATDCNRCIAVSRPQSGMAAKGRKLISIDAFGEFSTNSALVDRQLPTQLLNQEHLQPGCQIGELGWKQEHPDGADPAVLVPGCPFGDDLTSCQCATSDYVPVKPADHSTSGSGLAWPALRKCQPNVQQSLVRVRHRVAATGIEVGRKVLRVKLKPDRRSSQCCCPMSLEEATGQCNKAIRCGVRAGHFWILRAYAIARPPRAPAGHARPAQAIQTAARRPTVRRFIEGLSRS